MMETLSGTTVCDFVDTQYGTNLNGVYSPKDEDNERVIAFCRNKSLNQCLKRDARGKYIFTGETIKLSKTKIYLKWGTTGDNNNTTSETQCGESKYSMALDTYFK